jgi:ferrochelatase
VARTAVVLFNLGGPDRPEAVKPFLVNLFSDPAILRVPGFIRPLLAQFIAARRAKIARGMYDRIGGGSPILKETEAQAQALKAALGADHEVFIAMRYWHPMTDEAARRVRDYRPDKIVLLPLYPQYSTTTTESSLTAWQREAVNQAVVAPTVIVKSYPVEAGFIAALVGITRKALAGAGANPKVLFSAHGLPQKFVDEGDPYATEVEATVAAVTKQLPGLDYAICYQSRIGPLEWLKPYTSDEIRAASRAKRPIVVVPVAFVSEHSETLVELDMDYRELAAREGAPAYVRAPTVSTDAAFIAGLARLVRKAVP